MTYSDMVNLSLNQVLMRSLNTSITALLPIAVAAGRRLVRPRRDDARRSSRLALLIGLLVRRLLVDLHRLAAARPAEGARAPLPRRPRRIDGAAAARPRPPRRPRAERPPSAAAPRRRPATPAAHDGAGPATAPVGRPSGRPSRARPRTKPSPPPAAARRRKRALTSGDDGDSTWLAGHIRDIPDFPKPGVVFKDITPLLADAAAFRFAVDALADHCRRPHGRPGRSASRPAASSSPRRSPTGSAPASCPVRKAGQAAVATVEREEYALEYGTDLLEIHRDAVAAGRAGAHRRRRARHRRHGGGHRPAGRAARRRGRRASAFLIELGFLGGRSQTRRATTSTVARSRY